MMWNTLELFPCPETEDTVWVECPRQLWPERAYPHYYDADAGTEVLFKVEMERLEQFTNSVRFLYEQKGQEIFRDREIENLPEEHLIDGRWFVKPHQGEAMHPYDFGQAFKDWTQWVAAVKPSDND